VRTGATVVFATACSLLDDLDDGALPFCAQFLRVLERSEGELEVMRCLLQEGGLVRLIGARVDWG
jgi:hypothetical protein